MTLVCKKLSLGEEKYYEVFLRPGKTFWVN